MTGLLRFFCDMGYTRVAMAVSAAVSFVHDLPPKPGDREQTNRWCPTYACGNRARQGAPRMAKGTSMSYRILPANRAFWRPSNHMGVLNTRSGQATEATTLGARLWRLHPGEASTRQRHRSTHELYVLLEGTGRIRIGEHHGF